MTSLIPALRVRSYKQSKSFYVEGLGFSVKWEHRFQPNYPVFAGLMHDGSHLYLSEHEGDCQPGALVYMDVPDVDNAYKRLHRAGIKSSRPKSQPWGRREMRVKDPDGNTICVCSKA